VGRKAICIVSGVVHKLHIYNFSEYLMQSPVYESLRD